MLQSGPGREPRDSARRCLDPGQRAQAPVFEARHEDLPRGGEDAGQRGDIDLMRDQQRLFAGRIQPPQQIEDVSGLCRAGRGIAEEGIELGLIFDLAQPEQDGGVAATAPLAGQHPVRLDAGRPQALTDPPRLLAPGHVQIALGTAVGKAEVSRVAKAGGQRMAHKQVRAGRPGRPPCLALILRLGRRQPRAECR